METRLRLCRHIATVTNSSIGYQNMVFVYIETLPQFVFEFDHFAPKPPPLLLLRIGFIAGNGSP